MPQLPLIGQVRGASRNAQPFLKWAGGKRQVLPRLLPYVPERWSRYHEPFMGGGALFFELNARTARADSWAVLTDNNERLVRTCHAIRDQLPEVIEILLHHAERHGEEWFYEVRGWDVDAMTDTEVAGWMIYLNRAGFNGLYRVNSKNRFNVPFGRNTNPTICDAENLRRVRAAFELADVRHGSFEMVLDDAREGDLVYFDPPYVPLNGTALFTAYTKGGFGPADQVRLRDVALLLKQRGVHVILSNHDTDDVRGLYADGFHLERIPVSRRINSKADKRGAVDEVIIS